MEYCDVSEVKRLAETNDAFLQAICEAESSGALMSVCKDNNLNISEEDAENLFKGIVAGRENTLSSLELSESDLEEVAGGFVVTWTTVVIIGIGLYALYEGGKKLGKWLKPYAPKW